jgi:diacylglycerol O-acyltransferase
MDRLSATDASLVHGEIPEWHLHVTSLLKLDEGTMQRGYRFETFRAGLAARLRTVPRLSQQIVEAPLGLDRPVWVDRGPFDVERHIRRVVVDDPGTDKQLFELAAAAASTQLPHDRPLWECQVIETPGAALKAVIIKNHHAMFDGVGGLETMLPMFDTSPEASTNAILEQDVDDMTPPLEEGGGSNPHWVEMLARSAVRGLTVQPLETVKVARQLLRQAVPFGQALLRGNEPLLGLNAPRNPFPGRITGARVVSGAQLPMPLIKDIRRKADVKVNDVLLAVVGGAVRNYLSERGRLTANSLVANVAVSTRAGDDSSGESNMFSAMFVTLGTDIDDPDERLETIHAGSVKSKRLTESLAVHRDTTISAVAPPIMVNALARLYKAARVDGYLSLIGNVGVSNVAGPPVSLYVGGAAVCSLYVYGPLMLNSVVNFTAVSNGDSLDIGITSSPSIVPDIHDFAEYLRPALDELAESVGVAPA